MKDKKKNEDMLIPVIIALLLAVATIITLAFVRPNFLFWLVMVFLLLLDIIIAIIFTCKNIFSSSIIYPFHHCRGV